MNFQGAIKTIRTEGTARIMVPEITATQSMFSIEISEKTMKWLRDLKPQHRKIQL